ncbi:lysozyme-like isoform X1 [Eriocheir sinensis]|uniref:lysozyme-like isoform X1 n=1 Tax=Eriocheir sinensis TaxID=95602 RepID=UPI0021C71470|nr:lysozyme-like isoform X1 [Eriocheir sinensis]
MSLLQRVIASVTAALILAVLSADAAAEVDPNCLGCLCEGATKCNATTQCHVPYAGAYFCGPFHISWAYWADAGKPVMQHDNPEKQGAFENCATDLYCSARIVREYMNKFGKDPKKGDCNGDGKIDCVDYAYMHRLGGFTCKDPSMTNTSFFERFNTCWQVVQAALPKESPQAS